MVFALAISAAYTEAPPHTIEELPVITIDPCVGVDEDTVGQLLDLELRSDRADGSLPESVSVRCIDGAEEIRIDPWAQLTDDGIRVIQLAGADDADSAARESRARELALAIAELIRRVRALHPLAPLRSPPVAPTPPPVVVAPPAEPGEHPPRWEIGLFSAVEHFNGGATFAGADVVLTVQPGSHLQAQVSLGGRGGPDQGLSSARLTESALVGSAGAGPFLWTKHHALGFGAMLRAEGYLVRVRVSPPDGAGTADTTLGAFVLTAEAGVLVALARRVALTAGAGVGGAVHGVTIRSEDTERESVSGLIMEERLGAVLSF